MSCIQRIKNTWCPMVQPLLSSLSIHVYKIYVTLKYLNYKYVISPQNSSNQYLDVAPAARSLTPQHKLCSLYTVFLWAESNRQCNYNTLSFQHILLEYILELRMPGKRTYRPILRKIEPVRVSVFRCSNMWVVDYVPVFYETWLRDRFSW